MSNNTVPANISAQFMATIATLNNHMQKESARMTAIEAKLSQIAPAAQVPVTAESSMVNKTTSAISELASFGAKGVVSTWSAVNTAATEAISRSQSAVNPTVDAVEGVIQFGIGTAGTVLQLGNAVGTATLQTASAIAPEAAKAVKAVLTGALGTLGALFGAK